MVKRVNYCDVMCSAAPELFPCLSPLFTVEVIRPLKADMILALQSQDYGSTLALLSQHSAPRGTASGAMNDQN